MFVFALAACNGDKDSTSIPVTSYELLDPTPAAGNSFGTNVTILANGNIIITTPTDSAVATLNGAVHLYNPLTQTLINSIFGDTANDILGSGGITALANNNFVIASPYDGAAGVDDAGSVKLVNGTTGNPIGITIVGDTAYDRIGSETITVLANNNFVIISPYDDVAGVINAGSVKLVNGTTGALISSITGDTVNEFLGSVGITVLANNNFVIVSPSDDIAGMTGAGSVQLIDGTTGMSISTITGNSAGDYLGSSGITALTNNNFVIASPSYDVAGITDAGSVQLVDGTTGMSINTITGNSADDYLGSSGITALPNNNFVIVSQSDDVVGVTDAGSVQLADGTTGISINTITGDTAGDYLGSDGITVLANNNFVITSLNDVVAGMANAGSVKLVNGDTGALISSITGDTVNELFGMGGVAALANNNFVVVSRFDNITGATNAGSVRLVDGTTGNTIGSIISGDTASDFLGSGGITVLANNNFVIVSPYDDVVGVTDAGSVQLVDGTTGEIVGIITGDTASDFLGAGSIAALTNNNFVVASVGDVVAGEANVGSVKLINGTTGALISSIIGDTAGDSFGSGGITVLTNNNFVIVSPLDDVSGVTNAGSVQLVDGSTGAQTGNTITGSVTGDMTNATVTESANGDFYVLGFAQATNNSLATAGLVQLIAE